VPLYNIQSIIRELEFQKQFSFAASIQRILSLKSTNPWKKDYPQIMSWGSMTPELLKKKFPWFLKARVKDAELDYDGDILVWKNGTWKEGKWVHGKWEMGTWERGTWEDGVWLDGEWKKGVHKQGYWHSGKWRNGTWEDGFWNSGTWEDGIWEDGTWKGKESKD